MTPAVALCNVFTFQIQRDAVTGHKYKQVAAFIHRIFSGSQFIDRLFKT